MKKNIKNLFSKLCFIGLLCCFTTIYSQQYNEVDDTNSVTLRAGALVNPDCFECVIIIPRNTQEYFKWRFNINIRTSGAGGLGFFSTTQNYFNDQYHRATAAGLIAKADHDELLGNIQDNVYKVEIEQRFNKTYPNIRTALTDYLERLITAKKYPGSRGFSRYKESERIAKKELLAEFKDDEIGLDRITNNLFLIKLRETEIKANNISNSSLGKAQIGSVLLKDVTSLGDLDNMWQSATIDFGNYHLEFGKGQARVEALSKLKTETYAHRMANDYFYKSLEDRLLAMDQYLGWIVPVPFSVANPNGTIPDVRPWYIIDKDHLLADAKRNAVLPREVQIFDENYYRSLHPTFHWGILQERKKVINDAIANLNRDDVLASNFINTLSTNAKNYINERPALKTEVENYFKVNDYSEISHDCINYLLNQFHNGNDFTPNTNLYKSATTPLFQNSQNRNRALEWRPGTQAVREG